jgi:sporulation protein YlmC with PRC-barrel domain
MNPAVLNGKKVIGSDGYMLGEWEGVNIDSGTWNANTFNVKLSDEAASELGFRKSFMGKILICLPTSLVKVLGDIIALKEPIRNLEKLAEKEEMCGSPELKGKKVVGAKGYTLGVVEGFDLDPGNWRVTGLEVDLTDDAAAELGFKRPFLSKVVVVVPTRIVGMVGNFVTLDKEIKSLESLVECLRSCQKQD